MAELKDLKIERDAAPARRLGPLPWAALALAALALAGGALYGFRAWSAPLRLPVVRVRAERSGGGSGVLLNATGYIVAAHKIELSSKVVGKVAWIGVDKGDRVSQGQVLVRLEDEEYRAQLAQARGSLAALQARLAEALAGSRPEEIAEAQANLAQARADAENARINLERVRQLAAEGVLARQSLDDAQARYQGQAARAAALEKRADLVRLGPRREQIDALRGQVEQARGAVAFAETMLANTVVRAPISGTILERAVEKGEFVTTSFVGDRGAKGYVVSLADLGDLEVELDINQNDFARLAPDQKGWVTTDTYPDRRYDGVIRQIAPEANRQKATVEVKVKILTPDGLLRPDMNASVAFYSEEKPSAAAPPAGVVVPASAVRGGAVFLVSDGKAVRRAVRAGAATAGGVRIEAGLIGGEDLVLSPPPGLQEGQAVLPAGETK